MTEVKEETISNDELQFQRLLQFAQLAKYVKKDLNSNKTQTSISKSINKDDLITWMKNPSKYEKQLRNLSRFLYDTSSHYKRLVQYFSTMLTFDYCIEPYGMTDFEETPELIQSIQKKYLSIANFLDVMNLKHEFLKVCERAWIDGIAYFYEYRLKDSYFLMQLNPDYCDVTGIEDGCVTFSFDFSFFKTYPDELDRYADEFKEKFEIYKQNAKNYRWQEIDPTKSLCIKIDESVEYPIPPFCGLFLEVFSVEDYKSLKLVRSELENYLLLVAKIPYLKESNIANNFALEINKAIEYFQRAMNELPDSVGGFLSPFESIDAIKIDRNDKSSDYVSDAQKYFYDSAGVSQLLFNGNDTASTVAKSIMVDENLIFKTLRQLERWVNKKLKDENKVIKFKVQFLDITKFNQDNYIKNLKEGATLGVPIKLKYAAALGQSPSSLLTMQFLENTVFDIANKWKPLSSSYTQSNDAGRPEGDDDNLTEGGQIARDLDTNNPDNRA